MNPSLTTAEHKIFRELISRGLATLDSVPLQRRAHFLEVAALALEGDDAADASSLAEHLRACDRAQQDFFNRLSK